MTSRVYGIAAIFFCLLVGLVFDACNEAGGQAINIGPRLPIVASSSTPSSTSSPGTTTFVGQVTNADATNGGLDACPVSGTVYFTGYGCIPVNTANATVTGTYGILQYFTAVGVWNPAIPLFTAQTIAYVTARPSSAPSSVPTAIPTASPSPTPTATPTASPTPSAAPTAPILLVHAGSVATPSAAVSTITATYTAPAQNHFLEACVLTQDSNTIAPPSGWIAAMPAVNNTGGLNLYMFYKFAGASEPSSVTFTASAADYMAAEVREYSGVNYTTPFSGTGSSTTTTNVPAVTVAPSVANTLPSSCFAINSATGVSSFIGSTLDFTAYANTQSGNGFVPYYNGLAGITGPLQSGTAAYTAGLTWNLTSGNGPATSSILVMLAPQGTVVPTPTPAPTSTGYTLVNGAAQPAGFRPYAPTSVWNSPLPTITPGYYTSDSATIVSEQFPSSKAANSSGQPLRDNEPGQYDGGRAIYYGSATSSTAFPSVNSNCSNISSYGSNACWPNSAQLPTTFNIPEFALPSQDAYGGDSRLDIIDGATGNEYDFYSGNVLFNPPNGTNWVSGNNMTSGTGFEGSCGNYFTGTGLYQGAYATAVGPTAASQCAEAGLLQINDLLAGSINHALIIATNCTNPGGVFPAGNNSTNNCTDGVGPQLGYRLWYDVPDATTNAVTTCTGSNANCLWPYEKAILNALHDYGAFVMDDFGGGTVGNGSGSGLWGMGFATEGMEPAYQYAGQNGNPNPNDIWAAMAAQGWTGGTISGTPTGYKRWYTGDQDANGNWAPYGVNWAAHLHYLKACVSQGTC